MPTTRELRRRINEALTRGIEDPIRVLEDLRARFREAHDRTRGARDSHIQAAARLRARAASIRFREEAHDRSRAAADRIRGAVDDMAIQESIASYKKNLTPAARSFIHGLKKFRLDSLEEGVFRKTPRCTICLENFAESVEQLITCLPCDHYFHVNCIVMCLEINHLCPLCRYPMPTLEAGEPSTKATAN